jgi:hypothetical protein
MELDPVAANRLLWFCSQLSEPPEDEAATLLHARFSLDVFRKRLEEVEQAMSAVAGATHEIAALRCEAQALRSAPIVIAAMWRRRFGAEMPAG